MRDQYRQIIAAGVLIAVGLLLIMVHSVHNRGEPLPAVLRYPLETAMPSVAEPNVTFSGQWPEVPKQIMLYRAECPPVDEAYARRIAEKYFGFSHEAECINHGASGPNGCFRFINETNIVHVYRGSGSFGWWVYLKPLNTDPCDLPPAEQWRQIARDFLDERGLLPDDAVIDDVHANFSNPGSIVVRFCRVINGRRSWGGDARILVTIGPHGKVYELSYAWSDIKPAGKIAIRSPQDALESLIAGEGTLRVEDADITSISLRYSCPLYRREYFQPVYYFEGAGPEGDLWGVLAPALRADRIQSKQEYVDECTGEQARVMREFRPEIADDLP